MKRNGSDLTLRVEFATDLFDPQTFEETAAQYQRLLQQMVSHPEDRLEKEQILT